MMQDNVPSGAVVKFESGATLQMASGSTTTLSGTTDAGAGPIKTDAISESTASAGITLNHNTTLASGKSISADTDKVKTNGIPIHPIVPIKHTFAASGAGRGDFAFIADRAYTVTAIKERHNVVSTGAAVLTVRKITAAATLADAAAGATVKELLSSSIDLQGTAGTTASPALTATGSDLILAAGDVIGIKSSADTTGLVGCVVTILLQPT